MDWNYWRKRLWPEFGYCMAICIQELWKTTKATIRIASFPTGNRTGQPSSTRHKRYRLSHIIISPLDSSDLFVFVLRLTFCANSQFPIHTTPPVLSSSLVLRSTSRREDRLWDHLRVMSSAVSTEILLSDGEVKNAQCSTISLRFHVWVITRMALYFPVEAGRTLKPGHNAIPRDLNNGFPFQVNIWHFISNWHRPGEGGTKAGICPHEFGKKTRYWKKGYVPNIDTRN